MKHTPGPWECEECGSTDPDRLHGPHCQVIMDEIEREEGKSRHTPGPWHWEGPGHKGIMARSIHPASGDEYWRDIATVERIKAAALRGGCDPESQANARLIARAPTLLQERDELAEIARLIAHSDYYRGTHDSPRCAGCEARALLARLEE